MDKSNWYHQSADFDHHPQVMEAGWHAAQLFLLLLRISKRFKLDGVIPVKYLDPEFLGRYWGGPPDFPYAESMKRLKRPGGLCVELEDGAFVIDGWGRWNPRSSTERVQRFREMKRTMKRGETNETQSRVEESRVDKIKTTVASPQRAARAPRGVLAKDLPVVLNTDVGRLEGGTPEQRVFVHWAMTHQHFEAAFDQKREKIIKAAFALGYQEDQIYQAIAGCKASAYHQGQNESKTVYDSLSLILRDAEHIDMFISKTKQKPLSAEGFERHQENGLT